MRVNGSEPAVLLAPDRAPHVESVPHSMFAVEQLLATADAPTVLRRQLIGESERVADEREQEQKSSRCASGASSTATPIALPTIAPSSDGLGT
jgi:hypothetical protein